MQIISFDPENKFYRKQFIKFAFDLYHDDPFWVPPMLMDLKAIFKPNKHGFYEHGKVNFLIAMDGNRPVGRLVALYNDDLQPHHQQNTANFFLFESVEDKSVAEGLFEKAKSWSKQHGAKRIYGPKGMTPMDGLGLLIRGFDRRPAFGMPYNQDYYANYIQEI